MLFSSLALGVGVTRKIHEEREEREKKIKQVEKQMPRWLTDPLSAKETQQQIAALHCQIYS